MTCTHMKKPKYIVAKDGFAYSYCVTLKDARENLKSIEKYKSTFKEYAWCIYRLVPVDK